MIFETMIEGTNAVLTEGGVVERINRDPAVALDPHIAHAGLIYDDHARQVLEEIYTGYIDIGARYSLPMLTMAPTWRANPERVAASAFSGNKRINQDGVDFLKGIRSRYGDYANNIYVGGLMACRGDAYQPQEAMSAKDAEVFHADQAGHLAQAQPDFIKCATLPAVSEALGLAKAISIHRIPYILSFVIRQDGTILDSTPIAEAISLIDSQVNPKPSIYMVNCVHPAVFRQAMETMRRRSTNASVRRISDRIMGLQANTSAKSPEELDGLDYLDTTDPDSYSDLMVSLHHDFGLKVLGGCCGSDQTHIEQIASKIRIS